jgi:O-antigen/teichoic acid export membrane protein
MSIAQIFKRYLPRSSFVRGVVVLGGGAAASQLILMAVAPLLTRLYSAQDFGVVAVFGSMLSILSVVSSLRYELAIPIAKDDEEALHGVVLALLVAVATTLVTFLAVLCFRVQIAEAVKIPQMTAYLWLLPIGLLLLSVYQVFYYWAIRVQAFSAIAQTRLTQSISSVVVQIGGSSFGLIGLLLGQITGQAAGIYSLGLLVIQNKSNIFRTINPKALRLVAWRYRRFPCFSTWGSLLNTIGMQLPPVMFSILFSPAVVGIYALAHRVLSLPMSLIGQAIGNVFLARASEAKRDGNLAVLVANVHDKLAQIAMPPVLVLVVIAPELFVWIFGSEWREAGIFAQLMTPMLYFQFIFSPISTLFVILEKQQQGMFLQAVMATVSGSSIFIGAWLGDVKLAVLLFSLGSASSYLAFLVWVINLSGNRPSLIIKSTIQAFSIGLSIISPMLIAHYFSSNSFMIVCSTFLTFFLIGCRYFTIFKPT